jgi:hypothetical protein
MAIANRWYGHLSIASQHALYFYSIKGLELIRTLLNDKGMGDERFERVVAG